MDENEELDLGRGVRVRIIKDFTPPPHRGSSAAAGRLNLAYTKLKEGQPLAFYGDDLEAMARAQSDVQQIRNRALREGISKRMHQMQFEDRMEVWFDPEEV